MTHHDSTLHPLFWMQFQPSKAAVFRRFRHLRGSSFDFFVGGSFPWPWSWVTNNPILLISCSKLQGALTVPHPNNQGLHISEYVALIGLDEGS